MEAQGMHTDYSCALRQLAADCGVLLGYRSTDQTWVEPSREQLIAHLRARGIECSNVEQVHHSLFQRSLAYWTQPIDPVLSSGPSEQPLVVTLRLPQGVSRIKLESFDEQGKREVVEATTDELAITERWQLDGRTFNRFNIELPGVRSPGYQKMLLSLTHHEDAEAPPIESLLVVGPDSFYQPPGDDKYFGGMTLLQCIPSRESFGMGGFREGIAGATAYAARGASFFAPGPLSLCDWPWGLAAPFMRMARLFNHLFIDCQSAIERLGLEDAARHLQSAQCRAYAARLRATKLMLPDKVGEATFELLSRMWSEFQAKHLQLNTSAGGEYRNYVSQNETRLRLPASFLVVREHFFPRGSTENLWHWKNWPEQYQRPDSPEVAKLLAQKQNRIEFVYFTQWLAQRDIERWTQSCSEAGMTHGLVSNVPIGMAQAAAETWYERDTFYSKLVLGVPPDPFDRRGQSWGYPARDAQAMLRAKLAPFITDVRFAMQGFGHVEFDHGPGWIERTWVYPDDLTAQDGVYVRWPMEHALRVIALESQRNRCVVSPELLGTISDEVVAVVAEKRGSALVQQRFKKRADGSFPDPWELPWSGMLLGGTHNMVPEAVWLLGLDIELARKCQNLDPQRVTALQQERAGERRVFCDMLVRNSLLDYETAAAIMALAEVDLEVTADFLHGLANEPLVLAFVRAAHISRARASCRALAIDTIEAQIGLEPLNLPGVAEGYPSWLIRLPVPVEDWLANSAFSSVLAAVAQERPRH